MLDNVLPYMFEFNRASVLKDVQMIGKIVLIQELRH